MGVWGKEGISALGADEALHTCLLKGEDCSLRNKLLMVLGRLEKVLTAGPASVTVSMLLTSAVKQEAGSVGSLLPRPTSEVRHRGKSRVVEQGAKIMSTATVH
jgi:hypothetical protein